MESRQTQSVNRPGKGRKAKKPMSTATRTQIEQAIEFATSSVFTAEVYHATSAANIDSLLADGFDLGRAGDGIGSVFGAAIYVTQDAGETLAYYLSNDGYEAVAGRIRVANPLYIAAESWMHEDELYNRIAEAIDTELDGLPTVAEMLAASTYDAIIIDQDEFDRQIGGSQIILQSPDQIMLYPMPAEVMTAVHALVWG